jgi:hypothetical protein
VGLALLNNRLSGLSLDVRRKSMTVTAKLALSDADLALFREGSLQERERLIQGLFESLDEADVARLLAGFCIGDRETYDGEPAVAGVSFEDERSGTITVSFTGSAYYGCKEMNRLDEHDEAVLYTIGIESAFIQFSTHPPDPQKRYPNEEL